MRNCFLLFCFVSLSYVAPAQEISLNFFQGVGISNAEGLSSFASGPGAQVSYLHATGSNSRLILGMEARTINWGNQIGLEVGYQRTQKTFTSRLSTAYSASVYNSIVLFRPRSIYSLGIEVGNSVRYQTKKRSYFQLEINARYNVAPGYKQYGIYRGLEIPIGIRYGLRLGRLD